MNRQDTLLGLHRREFQFYLPANHFVLGTNVIKEQFKIMDQAVVDSKQPIAELALLGNKLDELIDEVGVTINNTSIPKIGFAKKLVDERALYSLAYYTTLIRSISPFEIDCDDLLENVCRGKYPEGSIMTFMDITIPIPDSSFAIYIYFKEDTYIPIISLVYKMNISKPNLTNTLVEMSDDSQYIKKEINGVTPAVIVKFFTETIYEWIKEFTDKTLYITIIENDAIETYAKGLSYYSFSNQKPTQDGKYEIFVNENYGFHYVELLLDPIKNNKFRSFPDSETSIY